MTCGPRKETNFQSLRDSFYVYMIIYSLNMYRCNQLWCNVQ